MSATTAPTTPASGGDQKIPSAVDSPSSTGPFDGNKSRRDLIGDCALVEIIHLHDCLRGALNALEKDLIDLSKMVLYPANSTGNCNSESKGGAQIGAQEAQRLQLQQHHQSITELESKATARFQVIWSVFRAHSAAEDEFIWPTLRDKTKGAVSKSPCGSPKYQPNDHHHQPLQSCPNNELQQQLTTVASAGVCNSLEDDEVVEQEEYEEDHADEERMFTMMDHLLTRLHKGLVQLHQRNAQAAARNSNNNPDSTSHKNGVQKNLESITNTTKEILSLAKTLNQHLMVHLEKEEKNCLPLVVKHLSKSEIHDLVGKIMGKRSSDTIAQILTMAVQNLKEADREEMVKHMKQAMMGTFFETWLAMTGWMGGSGEANIGGTKRKRTISITDMSGMAQVGTSAAAVSPRDKSSNNHNKRKAPGTAIEEGTEEATASSVAASLSQTINDCQPIGEVTSQENLEKLIRAVVTNPSLTPVEKNTTIQGLRASVWKRNQQLLGKVAGGTDTITTTTQSKNNIATSSSGCKRGHLHFPTSYYQRDTAGKINCVWKLNDKKNNNDIGSNKSSIVLPDDLVPKFKMCELAPNYQDGATGVLGCHHYARACKLRHPVTGNLYTCRLCAEQEREASAPSDKENPPLDRYAVTEIMCMKCNTLQPAAKTCVNAECELYEKGFAKYFCDICNLYDDRSRPIFHCPYCNTCRMGKGLGIDFRHCMRCNACVSLADKNHRCIPQKLQGSCPICYDTLFNSTEPLKGLRCGHVMHLSCYTEFCRGQNYTCPLCMRCMEDMSDYFSLLDQAVRMQPMPAAFQNTIVNTYCQDCEKTGQCRYHFVGQKCSHCGSYNTREMGRYEQPQPTIVHQR